MVSKINVTEKTVCIVGLGYVGMPLVEAFAKHVHVIGFDINEKKVSTLKKSYPHLELISEPKRITEADIIIIAVPTPVLKSKEPDLDPVISASRIVGKNLKKGAIVVLESTVYPGVTEELVVPILEAESELRCGVDFKIGYSPERVNPGDKEHTIEKITKIVSGMDEESSRILAGLYGTITTVYTTKDIKTAEAAKVIENIQRDLNIALMNELSIIFQKIGVDTKAVLDAASTKWNFNRYHPGLVGGHCIPVDPYYLVYKAKALGYHPQVILAGRAINDYMPNHVAMMTIKALNDVKKVIHGSSVLVMGLTFKENIDDTRETPVKELIKKLKEFGCIIYGYDPFLSSEDIVDFNIKVFDKSKTKVDCVIFTVAHYPFTQMSLDDIKALLKNKPILLDIREFLIKPMLKQKGFIIEPFKTFFFKTLYDCNNIVFNYFCSA